MRWVAPTEKDEANHQLEKRLWDAADQFRANSGLKAYQAKGVLFLTPNSRFDYLLARPEGSNVGMFVQSARFVAEHKKNPSSELFIFGVEKTDETGRLCRMNLAVHGLDNVNAVDKDRLKDAVGHDAKGNARRFPFGLPRTENLVDCRMASHSDDST